MPLHHNLQQGRQEPPVPPGLVLGAAVDGVGDVAKYSVEADESGKVGRLQHVNHIHELGRIDSIARSREIEIEILRIFLKTYVNVKIHRGNRQVCRNCVMTSFLAVLRGIINVCRRYHR